MNGSTTRAGARYAALALLALAAAGCAGPQGPAAPLAATAPGPPPGRRAPARHRPQCRRRRGRSRSGSTSPSSGWSRRACAGRVSRTPRPRSAAPATHRRPTRTAAATRRGPARRATGSPPSGPGTRPSAAPRNARARRLQQPVRGVPAAGPARGLRHRAARHPAGRRHDPAAGPRHAVHQRGRLPLRGTGSPLRRSAHMDAGQGGRVPPAHPHSRGAGARSALDPGTGRLAVLHAEGRFPVRHPGRGAAGRTGRGRGRGAPHGGRGRALQPRRGLAQAGARTEEDHISAAVAGRFREEAAFYTRAVARALEDPARPARS